MQYWNLFVNFSSWEFTMSTRRKKRRRSKKHEFVTYRPLANQVSLLLRKGDYAHHTKLLCLGLVIERMQIVLRWEMVRQWIFRDLWLALSHILGDKQLFSNVWYHMSTLQAHRFSPEYILRLPSDAKIGVVSVACLLRVAESAKICET